MVINTSLRFGSADKCKQAHKAIVDNASQAVDSSRYVCVDIDDPTKSQK